MIRKAIACAAVLLAVSVRAAAPSGPETGAAVAPLKVFAATGMHEGKELDYAAERKEKPTLYLFVRDFDRPMARFMKALDGAIPQESAQAAAVAVWLTDQPDTTKEYLPRVQMSLKLDHTALAVFPGDRNGPDGWNLNPDARLTVVLAKKTRVVRSFGFMSVNETDVKSVREALKKAVGG